MLRVVRFVDAGVCGELVARGKERHVVSPASADKGRNMRGRMIPLFLRF